MPSTKNVKIRYTPLNLLDEDGITVDSSYNCQVQGGEISIFSTPSNTVPNPRTAKGKRYKNWQHFVLETESGINEWAFTLYDGDSALIVYD